MTEKTWRTTLDFRDMMRHLSESDAASQRKLMLLTAACLYRVRHYDTEVIGLLEGYADRKTPRKLAMSAVEAAARTARIHAYCTYLFWKDKCFDGADVACTVGVYDAASSRGVEWKADDLAERRLHADRIRCVFGNPFRAVGAEPAWRERSIVTTAQAIYDGKDFDALGVLADALEEAGCTSAELLTHLRSAGPHVRGCWALDLILGKE